METPKSYSLAELPYAYNALEPALSEKQLTIHYQKHHQAYVNNANNLLKKMSDARSSGTDFDVKAAAKEFSFNLSGHILHLLFWSNLQPVGAKSAPEGELAEAINGQFTGFECFKKEFVQAAVSCEGSGWAALALDPLDLRLFIVQIEKHNINLVPQTKLLLVVDVWEHAYYLDYANDRTKYVDAVWNIVNWNNVGKRYLKAAGKPCPYGS